MKKPKMIEVYSFPPPTVVRVPIAGTCKLFPVRRIFCIGRNYSDHVREMGGDSNKDFPIIFTKPADAIMADKSTIKYPLSCRSLHHEVELVAAIDKPLRQVDEDTASKSIFGLAVGVDLTRRDLQVEAKKNGLPWDCAKAFDQSAPISAIKPFAVLPASLQGKIELAVNGKVRQSGDLQQMIWSVPQILSRLSDYFELLAGDLIFTGTPAGVGALVSGDCVSASIAGVGNLQFQIS
ncbi:MAG: fumarylacetoacetate hydrolase family protein [Robiginitomaculum sp.]|nr:fumarylacetoacetate hydrolase family protein [Robiginitomaculum sp.]